MLVSSSATRNENSLPAARRRALLKRFMRLQVPCPPRPPLSRDTRRGRAGPSRLPPGKGERRGRVGHYTALLHLPQRQPQRGRTRRPSPHSQKWGTAAARPPAAQRERVPAFPYMPFIKTPPPWAGGELPRSISCHGDHKSRKSKNTHL